MSLNNSSPLPKSSSLPTIANYPSLTPPSRSGTADISSNGNVSNYNLQETLYRKVADRLQQHNLSVSGEMDKLLLQNRLLNEGELNIENEYRALSDIKERLRYNNLILETRSKEIDTVIKQVNNTPDVQVDEALCGTTVVANQLYELVGDDNAISDTVYFLAKALNSERIDLATFMKFTRMLSREQFMKRALIKKITQAA
ncbi:Vps23 core domain-containing protein [Mucor mucedo]|nr:Vps23 core domain-containing protein [Mucor mucedo]KAI7889167.1 Vps23 core domain-containing protein [Mucor mucedo]